MIQHDAQSQNSSRAPKLRDSDPRIAALKAEIKSLRARVADQAFIVEVLGRLLLDGGTPTR